MRPDTPHDTAPGGSFPPVRQRAGQVIKRPQKTESRIKFAESLWGLTFVFLFQRDFPLIIRQTQLTSLNQRVRV